MRAASVYVLRDRNGDPLYVGMSEQVDTRIKQHRSTSPFGHLIRWITVTECDDKRSALILEKQLIGELDPPYNDRGKGRNSLYSQTLGLQVAPEMKDAVTAAATEDGVAVAEWIRQAIDARLYATFKPARVRAVGSFS